MSVGVWGGEYKGVGGGRGGESTVGVWCRKVGGVCEGGGGGEVCCNDVGV